MDCLHPINLKVGYLVPCGKCVACRARQRNQWVIRLEEEIKHTSSCVFVTLTYDNDHYTLGNKGFPVLSKRDVQLFLKRLRKKLDKDKIRYFICGEYGPRTLRPHYHGLIFNIPDRYDVKDLILDAWSLGFVQCGNPTPARIRYVAKYCLAAVSDNSDNFKQFEDNLTKQEKPFLLSSRRPGIGASFLTDAKLEYHRQSLDASYTWLGGQKASLPRYYRNKIFDDSMKLDLFNRFKEKRKNESEQRRNSYANDYRARRQGIKVDTFLATQMMDVDYLYRHPEELTGIDIDFEDFIRTQELDKKEDYVRRAGRKHRESGKL